MSTTHEEDERWHVAIHEAGHLVLGELINPRSTVQATIKEEGQKAGRVLHYDDASDPLLVDAINKANVPALATDYHSMAIDQISMDYAGWAACSVILGLNHEDKLDGAEFDMMHIDKIAGHLCGDNDLLKDDLRTYCLHRAIAIVKVPAITEIITRIARLLIERETVTTDEVRSIIDRLHRPRA